MHIYIYTYPCIHVNFGLHGWQFALVASFVCLCTLLYTLNALKRIRGMCACMYAFMHMYACTYQQTWEAFMTFHDECPYDMCMDLCLHHACRPREKPMSELHNICVCMYIYIKIHVY